MKRALLLALLIAPPALTQDTAAPTVPRFKATAVDNTTLDRYLRSMVKEVGGQPGSWEFDYLDVTMMLVTDEGAGRMRIISPVIEAAKLTDEDRRVLLEANFHSALDARYALWSDALWAVFIHPMAGMNRPAFEDALKQVAALQRNYGTTYSSTDMQFTVRPVEEGAPPGGEQGP